MNENCLMSEESDLKSDGKSKEVMHDLNGKLSNQIKADSDKIFNIISYICLTNKKELLNHKNLCLFIYFIHTIGAQAISCQYIGRQSNAKHFARNRYSSYDFSIMIFLVMAFHFIFCVMVISHIAITIGHKCHIC